MTVLDMANEWLQSATADLTVAKSLLDSTWLHQMEIPARYCQQCAEKSLKAFLVANNMDPPKTHDLNSLAGFCTAIDNSFSELEFDCEKINPYAVAGLYPRAVVIDETITNALIAGARRVYDFCAAKITAMQEGVADHAAADHAVGEPPATP